MVHKNIFKKGCAAGDDILNSTLKGGGGCDSHFSPILSSLHCHMQAKGQTLQLLFFLPDFLNFIFLIKKYYAKDH